MPVDGDRWLFGASDGCIALWRVEFGCGLLTACMRRLLLLLLLVVVVLVVVLLLSLNSVLSASAFACENYMSHATWHLGLWHEG